MSGLHERLFVVTFNGARFDLPVLAKTFDLKVQSPHIDLLHEARMHGFSGGLKGIERTMGLKRVPEEEGDGEEAVRLWRQYEEAGDASSLDRLLAYNAGDVKSLGVLALVRHAVAHVWRGERPRRTISSPVVRTECWACEDRP